MENQETCTMNFCFYDFFLPQTCMPLFWRWLWFSKFTKTYFFKKIENFIWTEHSFKMTTVIKNKFFQTVRKLRTWPDNDLWHYLRPCFLQTCLQHIDRWMRLGTSSRLQDAPDCIIHRIAIWRGRRPLILGPKALKLFAAVLLRPVWSVGRSAILLKMAHAIFVVFF